MNADLIAATQKQPHFSAFLQQSILNAAQTENEQKHSLLAKLVAARLMTSTETTFALASQLASDAICRSTSQQLRLMALCCFLHEVRPKRAISISDYREWLDVHLQPFEDFEFKDSDARHLVAIACASFDPTSERNLDLLLRIKGGDECLKASFTDVPSVEDLQISWDFGLAGVILTSVGSIVGGLALRQITGHDYGPPDWK